MRKVLWFLVGVAAIVGVLMFTLTATANVGVTPVCASDGTSNTSIRLHGFQKGKLITVPVTVTNNGEIIRHGWVTFTGPEYTYDVATTNGPVRATFTWQGKEWTAGTTIDCEVPTTPAPPIIEPLPPITTRPATDCATLRANRAGRKWLVKFGCIKPKPRPSCDYLLDHGAGVKWLVKFWCYVAPPTKQYNPPVAGFRRRAASIGDVSVTVARDPQWYADEVARVLTRVYGYEVQSPTLIRTTDMSRIDSAAEFLGYGPVRLRPEVYDGLALGNPEALYILTHEENHKGSTIPCWGPQEEAITEAATRDVWPAVSKAVLGYVAKPIGSAYMQRDDAIDVWDIRAWSAQQTGGGWDTYDARILRRNLRTADCSEREAMIGPAY